MIAELESIWKLRPNQPSKVEVLDKETGKYFTKTIFRRYENYLKVPAFSEITGKSYMFNGDAKTVPEALMGYLEKAKKVDPRYNQMVVNWYEPGEYIEPHSDCDFHFVDDYKILVISLNESENIRPLVFEDRTNNKDKLFISANFFEFGKDLNTKYKHYVGTGDGRRVSITFRMLREDNA